MRKTGPHTTGNHEARISFQEENGSVEFIGGDNSPISLLYHSKRLIVQSGKEPRSPFSPGV